MSAAQNLHSSSQAHQAKVVVPGEGTSKAAAVGGTDKPSGGSALFVPGISAETIGALLQVMSILQEIANIYGELMVKQVDMQKNIANNLSTFNIDLGNNEGDEMIAQGIGGIAGGGISGIMTLSSLGGSSEITKANENLGGTKSYNDLLENRNNPVAEITDTGEMGVELVDQNPAARRSADPDLDQQVKERLKQLKARESFVNENGKSVNAKKEVGQYKAENEQLTDKEVVELLTPEELTELKTSFKEKLKTAQSKYDQAHTELNSRSQRLTSAGQATSSMASGAGQTAGSFYARDKGQSQASLSSSQAALQTAQGLSGQSRSNTETYLGKSFDIAQIISAISQANKTIN